MDKDLDLFAGTVNPDPYPQHGSAEAQQSWWARDRELKSGKISAPARENVGIDVPRRDEFALPIMPAPLGPFPKDATYDDRFSWVMRTSVACARAGVTEHNPALELEMLRLNEEYCQEQLMQVSLENSDLKRRLQQAEFTQISEVEERLYQFVRTFVVEQFTLQRTSLERRVLSIATKAGDYDAPSLDVLNAKVVLLDQRARELERLGPWWVEINTGQGG